MKGQVKDDDRELRNYAGLCGFPRTGYPDGPRMGYKTCAPAPATPDWHSRCMSASASLHSD